MNAGTKGQTAYNSNIIQTESNDFIHAEPKQISGMVEALKSQIDIAADRIISNKGGHHEDGAAIVFLGNHHDSIPRMLISDVSLTSKEIHLWQLMRIAISNPAMPDMMPSQAMLCQYLRSSRTTVSQSITALRIHRWITLCKRVRDSKSGQYIGNVYALHTEPLNIAETLYLDESYLDLVNKSASGKNKRLAEAASSMMEYIDDGLAEGDNIIGTPTTQLGQQAKNHIAAKTCFDIFSGNKNPNTADTKINTTLTNEIPVSKSATATLNEIQKSSHVQNLDMVENNLKSHDQNLNMVESRKLDTGKALSDHHDQKSDSEKKASDSNTFYHDQNLNMVESRKLDTVENHYICSSSINKNTTTLCSQQENDKPKRKRDPKHEVLENLRYPSMLKPAEITFAKKIICYVEPEQQQYMLDYLRDRLRAAQQGQDKPVSNPLGYLTKICKALNDGTLHSEQPSSYGLSDTDKPKQPAPQVDDSERFNAQMERYGAALERRSETKNK